jgi:hypothetical protein
MDIQGKEIAKEERDEMAAESKEYRSKKKDGSAILPKEHYEHDEDGVLVGGGKYSENNPVELDAMTDGLAGFLRKKKMSHK